MKNQTVECPSECVRGQVECADECVRGHDVVASAGLGVLLVIFGIFAMMWRRIGAGGKP